MVNFSFLFFFFPRQCNFFLSPPTPPSLHAGCVRAMVGHLKFRVFPPIPFAAIHCRQTTINNAVRKRKRHLCFFTTFLTVTLCKRRRKPIKESRAEAELGRSSFFFSFYFCVFDPTVSWMFVLCLLSVQIMKSCSDTLWPLEDCWRR